MARDIPSIPPLRAGGPALPHGEADFRAIFESPATGNALSGCDGRILRVNRKFCEIVGYTADELLTMTFKQLTHPDDLALTEEKIRALLRGELPEWTAEKRYVRKNGRAVWALATVTTVRDERGGPVRLVGAIQEITERKREEALRDAENRMLKAFAAGRGLGEVLESLVETLEQQFAGLRCSVLLLEPDGKHLVCAAAPSLPRAFREAISRVDVREGNGPCDSAAQLERRVVVEDLAQAPDSCREMALAAGLRSCWSQPIVGTGTGGAALLGTFAMYYGEPHRPAPAEIDLIEATAHLTATAIERRRTAEIEDERNSLRKAVRAHERVLGVVGHELRTPLAAMRAMTEFLMIEGARDTADFQRFVQNLHAEVVGMSAMANDLLEVARLTSGAARWNWSEVEVAKVCSEAMDSVRPLVDARRVRLAVEAAPELRMHGDAGALRRLLLNLTDNACKHTSTGEIRVRAAESCRDGRRWISLIVTDSGLGMTAETAERLGEAFALNSGMVGDAHVTGSGLGLAICKGIAAAHGGNIKLASSPGRGTEVTVTLRADLAEGVHDIRGAEIARGARS